MMDYMLASLAFLLCLGIWNMARYWADNFWLYIDYVYAYMILCTIVCMASITSFRLRGRLQLQFEKLREYADTSGVPAAIFYDWLMNAGHRHSTRSMFGRGIEVIIAPLSVVFIGVGAFGGGDYFLYASFLISCLVCPVMLAIPIARRLAMRKYLGIATYRLPRS
jgi:hypothetical protein